MAVNSETEINLKTLQRVDSNIVEIIDNASQVAIYKYERKLNKWVSFLFVYFNYNLVSQLTHLAFSRIFFPTFIFYLQFLS